MREQQIPIFVISLVRSQERRAHIAAQMNRAGLQFDFIEAIDGHLIRDADLSALDVDLPASRTFMGTRALTRGEIGCALSHLKVYQRISAEQIPAACILEDDAVLTDGFPQVLQAITASDRHEEMLLLGHFSNTYRSPTRGGECSFWSSRLTPAHRAARPVEFPYLAIGYVIRLSAAQKLLNAAHPIRMPADALTGRAEKYGVRLQLVSPPCVLPQSDFVVNSTIGERRDERSPVSDRNHGNAAWIRTHLPTHRMDAVLLFLRKLGLLRPPYHRNFLPETDAPDNIQR